MVTQTDEPKKIDFTQFPLFFMFHYNSVGSDRSQFYSSIQNHSVLRLQKHGKKIIEKQQSKTVFEVFESNETEQ